MTITINIEKEAYYAGEILIGRIDLTKEESVQINNNVTIRLHGFAVVFGTLGSVESRTDYLNKSSVLVVKSWKEAIYSGNFSLPFHFDLPGDLPSTFNHPNCKIVYYLDLVYDEVAEIKPKIQKQFIVVNKVDLNHKFELRSPFTSNGSFKHPFEYSLTTNRRGFLSGDKIKISMTIKNNSDVDIDYIPICLIETVIVWTKSKRNVEINQVVARTSFPNRVKTRSTETGQALMRVPALWPSSNDRCSIIDVAYYLVVVTKPADVMSKSLAKPFSIDPKSFDRDSRIPILIGTVAYKDDSMQEPPPYAERNSHEDELPVYDEFRQQIDQASDSSAEMSVELDSKQLTLPAVVPRLDDNNDWTLRNVVGSLFGF